MSQTRFLAKREQRMSMPELSFDFRFDRDRAVKRLCTLVEQLPVYGLTFSSAEKAPRILGFLAELPPREVEVSSSS